ncbi:hypothetical protein [Dinoroseobacter sp. S124A]|uniref:hypothetical protein n=1 Tax=Dinoroseobacter sp. S124A TaxID=3415128 RepID=UPI003C7DE954
MAPSDPKPARGRRKAVLELRVPFFRPMWRRVATVIVIALWTGVEIAMGNPYWALLAGGIGVYSAYVFFFAFDLPEPAGTSEVPEAPAAKDPEAGP